MLTPVLSRFWDAPEPWTLETYLRHEGTGIAPGAEHVAGGGDHRGQRNPVCGAAAARASRRGPSGRSSTSVRPSRATWSSMPMNPSPAPARTCRCS